MTRDSVVMVYGGTGISGTLTIEALLSAGGRPVVAGRDAVRVRTVAERYGLAHRAFALDDGDRIEEGLEDIDIVCNAAGPYIRTSLPLAEVCARTGTHYVDLCGEALPIERLVQLSSCARQSGSMIMPGIGFDVVPSDCLIAMLFKRLPSATRIDLGVSLPRKVSPGSASSFLAYAGKEVLVRRDGALVPVSLGMLERDFDFGDGPVRTSAIGWGDTATAYYTTGVPNVTTYIETNPLLRLAFRNIFPFELLQSSALAMAFWNAGAEMVLTGPSALDYQTERARIVAELEDDAGNRLSSSMTTTEPYSFTATCAAKVLERILDGDSESGFQTPARVYGADFILNFSEVTLDVH